MTVVGKQRILDFMTKYNQARTVMRSWLQLVQGAKWLSFHHLKNTCPTADLVRGRDLVVFDVRGNKYRITARVDYHNQRVLIQKVETHEEYE